MPFPYCTTRGGDDRTVPRQALARDRIRERGPPADALAVEQAGEDGGERLQRDRDGGRAEEVRSGFEKGESRIEKWAQSGTQMG